MADEDQDLEDDLMDEELEGEGEEEEPKGVSDWMASATPWWVVSVLLHILTIIFLGLITMTFKDVSQDDSVVVVTELVKPKDAVEDKPWIVLASRLVLTSPITLAADEALLVSGSRLDAQGPPAEIFAEHRFVARIHGPLEPFLEKLAARGGRGAVEGAHVVLDLAGTTTSELAGICAAADVAIVELMPVSRPIARAFL